MPADVLWVTGGQDHGARFALRGSSATIGRGPVMDIVLSDPRVSRRHARVRVDGARLLVEDLASSSGTAVNGVAIDGPTVLALGDLLVVGGTELAVVWTPTGSLPPPAPAPAPPVAVAPPPRPAPAEEPPAAAPAARPALLLPIACLVLAAFSVLALWMPALGDPSGTDSVWELHPSGLRVQALIAAFLTALAAALWLWSVADERAALPTPALAAATGVGGGLVAGLPLFLAAVDLPGVRTEAGLVLLALAGVAIAACAFAGVVLETRGPAPHPPDPAGLLVLAGGGVLGSLLAVAACPLTWISFGDVELGGLGGDGIAAGGWLIPLAVAVAAACALTVAVARAGDARRAVLLAAGATALAAAAATFATTAAITLRAYRMEIGLSLVLAGTAIAFVSTAIGAAAVTLRAPA